MANVPADVAQAITRKKLRYARYADQKEWDLFEKEVGTSDTQYEYQSPDGKTLVWGGKALKFASTKEFRAYYEPLYASMQPMHVLSPGDFTWAAGEGKEGGSNDEVEAVFAFDGVLVIPSLSSWAEMKCGGFYYETWKLVDDDWRLKDLCMRFQYEQRSLLMKLMIFMARFAMKS